MKIAIVDKAPSRVDYSKYFDFNFEVLHLSSVPVPAGTRFVKKMIDLQLDVDYWDLIILVGQEATKEYAGVGVSSYAGQLIDGKFTCMSNPALLLFKPEGQKDFDRSVAKIKQYAKGFKGDVAKGDFKGIDNETEAIDFLLEVLNSNAPFVALDTEGTALAPRDGYVLGLSISYNTTKGRYILTDVLNDRAIELIEEIIAKYEIVFHNAKYDVKMIEYHLGITFDRKRTHDTMVMHYVLDENDVHGLKPLALKYTDFGDYDAELDEFKVNYCKTHGITNEEFTYDLIPFPIISRYASIDTAVTFALATKFLPIIRSNDKLNWVYINLLMRGTFFLNDMEEVGIPISRERLELAKVYLVESVEMARAKIYTFPEVHALEKDQGAIFNPNSVMQLRKLLFDYAGLEPTEKRTATGAISTDAEVLEELSSDHPIPSQILKVRQLTKILSTYVLKILPHIDSDGRIRTNFNLIFTTSGRLSSSGRFNAQQIPRDDSIVKACILAPEGYSIVSQDLQTGEMYYAAVLSGDTNLQEVFKQGGDFHSSIAKMVFNLPCPVEEVKKKFPVMRQSAKAISFGILYGSGPAKVQSTVQQALIESGSDMLYTLHDAERDISTYFKKFSKLRTWLDSRKSFIQTNGYTYSFFGRKRRLTNVFSKDRSIAGHEVRSGINSEIQSLCSDVNLLGAMDTADELKEAGVDAKIFALVHDSIVAVVRDSDLDKYCEIVRRNTQKDRGCSIAGFPIGVDQEIGKDYSFGKYEKQYTVREGKLSSLQTGN